MENKVSLPCKQEPATSAYTELDQTRPPHPTSRRSILILYSHLRLGIPRIAAPLKIE
jgi:hypothetical protein